MNDGLPISKSPKYDAQNPHMNRDPRFAASLFYPGCQYLNFMIKAPDPEVSKDSIQIPSWLLNSTGYRSKKHFDGTLTNAEDEGRDTYFMRYAEILLNYAEALNESGATKTDVLTWVDLIRERAGLKGVEESWDTYTNNKKYETIDGRREIIQQERGIELAFEAQRFWDLRRWKLAFQEQNKPITGWNTQYSTNEDYYTEQLIYAQEFRIRNYFWPILDKELYSNKNLVQNYGW